MKNITCFFILWIFLFCSFNRVYSQSQFFNKNIRSHNKWVIQLGVDDLNYPPINSPFKKFFIKSNNNLLLPFYNIKLVKQITKQVDLYLDSSFGITENNKWNTSDGHFYKIIPGINYHIYKNARLDPYLKLGIGYHLFNYDNHQLIISKQKTFLENKNNFILLDGGIGMNFWILPNIGLNIQSEYNHVFSNTKPVVKDYLNFWRHSAGIVYNFNIASSNTNNNKNQHTNDTSFKIFNKNKKDVKQDLDKTDIDKTKTDIDKTKTDIDKTKTDIDKTKTDIDKIKTDIDKTKTELDKKKLNKKNINKKKLNKKKLNKKNINKKKLNKKNINKKKLNKKNINKKKLNKKNKKHTVITTRKARQNNLKTKKIKKH